MAISSGLQTRFKLLALIGLTIAAFAGLTGLVMAMTGPSSVAPEEPVAGDARDGGAWVLLADVSPPTELTTGGILVRLLHLPDEAGVAVRGAIPLNVLAVSWERDWPASALVPPGSGPAGVLHAVNAQLATAPAVAMAQGALSRHGDAMSLMVPVDGNVTTLILHAPETSDLIFFDWPTGQPYAYDLEAQAWVWRTDRAPAIVARHAEAST